MSRIAQDIILRPVITENSMDGIADRKYTIARLGAAAHTS